MQEYPQRDTETYGEVKGSTFKGMELDRRSLELIEENKFSGLSLLNETTKVGDPDTATFFEELESQYGEGNVTHHCAFVKTKGKPDEGIILYFARKKDQPNVDGFRAPLIGPGFRIMTSAVQRLRNLGMVDNDGEQD
ncbi:hypothetical protein M0P48_01760 [Candidatus Gracilibacteria bacterium]|jgi:hypothetical protein|nr:hypothetical protein [Candidatus Gracilibacteria bacterium]